MFSFIRGILAVASPVHCVLDVQGVGYKLFIPPSAYGKFPIHGDELLLHTSFVVREQSQALYGFLTLEERDLFELLMGITGVGPKMALGIIGHLSPQELHRSIMGNDLMSLCKIPGVGKKTAERLVIEMRDKLKDIAAMSPASFAIPLPHQQAVADAMSALVHLGYSHAVAQKAIQKSLEAMPEEIKLPDLITFALKHV